MNTYTLGIDLHKRTSAWVLIDGEYKEIWQKTSVLSHPQHISSVIDSLPVPLSEIKVAIEPTCGWRWVSDMLVQAGMDVHFANPLQMRCISESTQKHDKGDARTLARMLQSGFFPEAYKVSDDIYALRTLLRTRYFFVRQSTATKNFLQGVATTRGLHEYPGEHPLKKPGRLYIEQGDDIVSKALLAHIDAHASRIKTFDAPLKSMLARYPDAQLLMTIPGVGFLTALAVVAEAGDMRRFKDAGKLASFAGLVPTQRSSGDSVRFGHISNRGSRMLRTAITEAAMRITKKNAPHLYSFYEQLAAKKTAKQARVALARKLLTVMWAMVRTQTPFEEQTTASIGSSLSAAR